MFKNRALIGIYLGVRRKLFNAVHCTVRKVTGPDINEPWNSKFIGSISTPRVEHVGDNEIRLHKTEELLVLALENGQSLADFLREVLRSISVDSFHTFWQTRDLRELFHMGSNAAATARITVDGALENGGVCRCGDDRDVHPMHGEEPRHVHHGNEVAG